MTSLPREKNPNWKGGRTISSEGYVRIKMPEHPNADVAGYVYEHRLVAEKMLGRYLLPDELVHHKKEGREQRQNNAPDNLVVERSIAEHKMEHRKRGDLRGAGQGNPIVLCACGCNTPMLQFDAHNRPRRFVTGHNARGHLSYDPNEMIACACGCGTVFPKFDKSARPRRFVTGHNTVIANPRHRT